MKITDFSIKKIKYGDAVLLYDKYSSQKYSALLTGNGIEDIARYSILGINPHTIVSYNGKRFKIRNAEGTYFEHVNFEKFLKKLLASTNFDELPYPIKNLGLIGYLSYDIKDLFEKLPSDTIDNIKMPLLELVLYNDYFFIDQINKIAYEINLKYDKISKINDFSNDENYFSVSNVVMENSADKYMAKVQKIKDYIIEGDVYEVNLTEQVSGDFHGNPYLFFKKLFKINAAPFSAYLNFASCVVSNSPEMFLSLENNIVQTRPIKGTIARGSTLEEDKLNKKILMNSEKDQTELNMIIDLLRNDIGKVCDYGSVKVLSKGRLEAYENVYHLVGIIEGKLSNSEDIIDLIKATFPGGSITGCPKVRTMEIIEELEKYKRNLYTGSVVLMNKKYMISSIVIRSAFIKNGKIYFNAGGAVTIDSDPKSEYEEALVKLKSIFEAINYDSIL